MTWPSISVVIPAHNAARTIGAQVQAVCAQDYPGTWEVIVVDDASTDGTRAAADRSGSPSERYRSLRLDQRSHQNSARNTGARASTGDVLAFTDGDDLVHPGWLLALAQGLDSADLVGGAIDDITLNTAQTRRRRPPHPTQGLPLALGAAPYALGTNLAIRRSAFDQIHGWDEAVHAGTDTDLCTRARAAGFRLDYVPNAIVAYRMPATRRALIAQNYRWGRADRRFIQTTSLADAPSKPVALAVASLHRLTHRADSPLRLGAYLAGRATPSDRPRP